MNDDSAFRFCMACGAPLAHRVIKAGDPPRLACQRCDFIWYPDPKVAVGTIIRTGDDGIVLVRRAIQPGYGLWVFPGGYIDRGEHLEDGAIREAREECGLEVELEGLLNVYSYRGKTPVIIVYLARATSGTLHAADSESLEARVFANDAIPWDSLAFESTHQALRDYLAGGRAAARGLAP